MAEGTPRPHSFPALTHSQDVAIYAEIAAAAQILNLTVTYDNTTLRVKDSTGKTVFTISDSGIIKQTGYDYTIVLVGALLILLAAATAIFGRKLRRNHN